MCVCLYASLTPFENTKNICLDCFVHKLGFLHQEDCKFKFIWYKVNWCRKSKFDFWSTMSFIIHYSRKYDGWLHLIKFISRNHAKLQSWSNWRKLRNFFKVKIMFKCTTSQGCNCWSKCPLILLKACTQRWHHILQHWRRNQLKMA